MAFLLELLPKEKWELTILDMPLQYKESQVTNLMVFFVNTGGVVLNDPFGLDGEGSSQLWRFNSFKSSRP